MTTFRLSQMTQTETANATVWWTNIAIENGSFKLCISYLKLQMFQPAMLVYQRVKRLATMGNRLAKQHRSSASFLHFSQSAGDPELAPCTMKTFSKRRFTPWKFNTFASENGTFRTEIRERRGRVSSNHHFSGVTLNFGGCDWRRLANHYFQVPSPAPWSGGNPIHGSSWRPATLESYTWIILKTSHFGWSWISTAW